MNNRKHCHSTECVLDVFQAAGFSEGEAADLALNYTCFPMDCDFAVPQARAYLAGQICQDCGVGLPEGGKVCSTCAAPPQLSPIR
jgi:hypothetical protein